MKIEVAGRTDVGIVRKANEDYYGYDAELGVFVLCDGVGGHAAGEVASKLGVETVLDYFRTAARAGSYPQVGPPEPSYSALGNAILSAIRAANSAVLEVAAKDTAHKGMASTIVLVVVRKQTIAVGHAGDSRAYLLREGGLLQLTLDHSLTMEQVKRGYMSMDEAEHAPMQSVIIKSLGSKAAIEPDVEEIAAEDEDVLLLACDGLTKSVPGDEITKLLQSEPDLERATALLIEAAKRNKSDDNITCILVRLAKEQSYAATAKQTVKLSVPIRRSR